MVALSIETNSFEVALEIYGALVDFEPALTPIKDGSEYEVSVLIAEEAGRVADLIHTVVESRIVESGWSHFELAGHRDGLRGTWPLTP